MWRSASFSIYGGKRATTAQLKRRYELDQHPVRCLCSNRRWLGSASRESSEPSIPAAARQLCWSVPFRGSTAGSHGAMCASSFSTMCVFFCTTSRPASRIWCAR